MTRSLLPALLLVPAALPAFTIVDTNGVVGNAPLFGAQYFAAVTVQPGDLLVITHANNKRDNGTNTVSAAFSGGTNTFTAFGSGDSGGQAGGYVFTSTITEGGTFAITLDTNNASKTVSQVTSYFVIRPDAGETVWVADTAQAAGNTSQTLTLDFSIPEPFVTATAFAAVGGASTLTFTQPAGWTDIRNGALRRYNSTLTSITAQAFSATWTASVVGETGGIGIVVASIPEPGSLALLGLGAGLLPLVARRRR